MNQQLTTDDLWYNMKTIMYGILSHKEQIQYHQAMDSNLRFPPFMYFGIRHQDVIFIIESMAKIHNITIPAKFIQVSASPEDIVEYIFLDSL